MSLGEVGMCGGGVGFVVDHGLKIRGKNISILKVGGRCQRDGQNSRENTTEIKKYTHNNQQHCCVTLGEFGLCGGSVGFVISHGLKNQVKNILIHEAGGRWQHDG